VNGIGAQIHSWINTAGIGGALVASIRLAWRAGRTIEKIDQHIEATKELFTAVHRRVEWLEQHRR
jgi:hypothetical protein